MVAFVKTNLKLFLRLVSSDIHNKEVSLSATEFNTLRILFKVVGSDGTSLENLVRPKSASLQPKGGVKHISSYAQFFNIATGTPNSSKKVHMNEIIDWINNLLLMIEPSEGVYNLNNFNKCVAIKNSKEIYNHIGNTCKLNIIECEDSSIFIDSNVEVLKISGCINCNIFVAAVNKICTIEKCENVTLCVAANQLRIGNCVDSTVHCYTPNLPPVVYGDTRNLRMAPHNASYPLLTQHLHRAGI